MTSELKEGAPGDKSRPPLKTGDTVPQGRTFLNKNDLVTLQKEGKARGDWLTLEQLKADLSEVGLIDLHPRLVDVFGLEGLNFLKVSHPDSSAVLYYGHRADLPQDSSERPIEADVVAVQMEIDRRIAASYGPKPISRLLPDSFSIIGHDQLSRRFLYLQYTLDVLHQVGRVDPNIWFLDGGSVELYEDDLETIPPKDRQKVTDRNNMMRFSRGLASDGGRTFGPLVLARTHILHYLGFLCGQNSEKLAILGRRDAWQIVVPDLLKLPRSS